MSGPNPANGSFDLWFSVHDAPSGGNQVGASVTNATTPVTSGLFLVDLDFGPGVFTGAPRWLEIGVRTNGAEPFTTLRPRQRIAPTAYALYAREAATAATAVSANAVAAGAVSTAGIQDSSVDSSKIADETITSLDLSPSLRNSTFWKLGGNAGMTAGLNLLGTTDNQSLELIVNGQRGFRLDPTTNSPNLIGGFSGNYVGGAITGATIGGGGFGGDVNSFEIYNIPPDEGGPPSVMPDFGTISGGSGNRIASGSHGTIAGGNSNSIIGWSRYFGGSDKNSIGGGAGNRIDSSVACTIAGGQNNWIFGGTSMGVAHSTIGGGVDNMIHGGGDPGQAATIAGGASNIIYLFSYYSAIGGGVGNLVGPYATGATVAGGVGNFVGAFANGATVAGGSENIADESYSTVGGGADNRCLGQFVVIAGGGGHHTAAEYSTISGGGSNFVSTNRLLGTIPGGAQAVVRSYGQLAYASAAS